MATTRARLAEVRPDRETLIWAALVLNTELLFVLAWAVTSSSEPQSLAALRLWVYPWIWIDVGVLAVLRTDFVPASARTRWLAGTLAVGYFAVLAYAGGLVGPGHAPATGARLVLADFPPGWAPALTYVGEWASVTLIPYRVVGYLALTYLVYATMLDAASSAVTGVLGLLSCVSCSWPVLASLFAGLAGSGSGVAAAVSAGSYTLSTAVFVVTVGLLYWRPFGAASVDEG